LNLVALAVTYHRLLPDMTSERKAHCRLCRAGVELFALPDGGWFGRAERFKATYFEGHSATPTLSARAAIGGIGLRAAAPRRRDSLAFTL
jgi:hypothetical protein